MGVHHPFRVAGGAARVAEPEGGVLVELGPLDRVAVSADEVLVVDGVRQRRLPPLRPRLSADHEAFDAGDRGGERLQDREEVLVDEDDPVLGVVDDVLEIAGPEPDVHGVQHGADRRDRVIELEVPPAVPHERRDPVAEGDPEVEEAVRELAGPAAGVGVRLAMRSAAGQGDHLLVGRDPGAAIEEPGHQERGFCIVISSSVPLETRVPDSVFMAASSSQAADWERRAGAAERRSSTVRTPCGRRAKPAGTARPGAFAPDAGTRETCRARRRGA